MKSNDIPWKPFHKVNYKRKSPGAGLWKFPEKFILRKPFSASRRCSPVNQKIKTGHIFTVDIFSLLVRNGDAGVTALINICSRMYKIQRFIKG